MANDDVIDLVTFGETHNLFCRMAYCDVDVRLEGLVCVCGLNFAQHNVMVLARLFNHGLRFNHAAELRWTYDRKHMHR